MRDVGLKGGGFDEERRNDAGDDAATLELDVATVEKLVLLASDIFKTTIKLFMVIL